jgi:Zn finger protein HypA/HybF involved in hydrogenase expression
MEQAITQLEIALEVVETNAPINEAEGNLEQVQLERECAASYRAAIERLKN